MSLKDRSEPIGTAQCRGCDNRTTVYVTDFGARCEECKDNAPTSPDCPECVDSDSLNDRCETCATFDPTQKPTYTPSLTTRPEDSHGEEMQENFEEFTDQLPDVGFDLELADGSVHEIDSYQSNAIILEYGDDWRAFLEAMTRKIDEHYQKETEPTKMVEYAPWGQSEHEDSKPEYESQAELAPVVLYAHLRGALMQMSLTALSGDEDDSPTVVGLGDNEVSVYSMDGSVTVEFDESGEDGFFGDGDSQ